MAARGTVFYASLALVVCVCSLWVGAGEAATDCTSALAGVAGCATFLSNPKSTPDQKTCCAPLESVLATPATFQCLCAQASNSQSETFKNALLLPQACKLSITVSEANCTTSTSPATSSTPASSTPAITTPVSSNSSARTDGSAGVLNASPFSPLFALALLWSIVSFLA